MTILRNILTLILASALAAFFLMYSLSFGESREYNNVVREEKSYSIKQNIVTIEKKSNGQSSLLKKSISSPVVTLQRGEAGYIDFGLLATVFVLSNSSGTLDFRSFVLSGSQLFVDATYPGVYSLYDPFSSYTVNTIDDSLSIGQITNGSFYLGKELDGTIAIYSIDAVIRIDFLSEGEKMTDMMLFPGMFIRFDPEMNRSLDGANLFRILQSLEPDGTQDITSNTTGIEFVNPRMNNDSESDTFFMYKLNIRTNILFQMLHVYFYDQVSQIDIFSQYGSSINVYDLDYTSSSLILNPGKKGHFLALKLNSVLSRALREENLTIEFFRREISEINSQAESLGVGNAIQKRLEAFLTDGRFALFGGNRINSQFPEIYANTAEIVNKTPLTPHAKLLQKLSDIYSKNLVAQKRDLTFSRIETYTPTALGLAETLESRDIEQRDYFDIALYAFHVLKKAEDREVFAGEAVYSPATYSLIRTILIATDRYVNSIDDPKRNSITYNGIALHFYEHMLKVLSRSVYTTFMEEQEGYIYLKENFRPKPTVQRIEISQSLINDLQSVGGTLSIISDKLDAQYGKTSTNQTYTSIKKSIAFFQGFVSILNFEAYTEYLKLPYIADTASDIFLIPVYQSGAIARGNPAETVRINGVVTIDPAIEKIVSLLGDIPRVDIVRDSGAYFINRTALAFPPTAGMDSFTIRLSVAFDRGVQGFSNIVITYKDRDIQMYTQKSSIDDFRIILSDIPKYIKTLEATYAANPSIEGNVRFLENTKKVVIGTYSLDLVP